MGAWGTGLYSSDTALDVRGSFREIKRLPVGPEKLIDNLLEGFPGGTDEDDEDYCTFWMVLADQFHAHAIDHEDTFARARSIIEGGQDLALNRDLGMEEADLKKREKALETLLAKWATPHPKPKKRNLLKVKEPFVMEPGQCIAYRTMEGNGPNLHLSQKQLGEIFHPDGWGAFVVIDRGRKWDYLARYIVAGLNLNMKTRPGKKDCLAAPIRAIRVSPFSGVKLGIPDTPLVRAVECPAVRFKKLDRRIVATFEWDLKKWQKRFPKAFEGFGAWAGTLTGTIHMLFSSPGVRLASKIVPVKGMRLKDFLG